MTLLTAYLDLGSADPPDGGQLPLKEEMVGLVVKAPLADGQGGAGVLDLLHHLVEFLQLVLPQVAVVLHVGHVQLVLGLWLGGLKRAGQDGQLHVFQALRTGE